METLIKIIKILKPKYYNYITRLIVICGASLITKPIWIDILNWFVEVVNLNNKKIKLPLFNEWDWIIGVSLIIIALIWHTYNRFLDLKENSQNEPAYLKIKAIKFKSQSEVCQSIYPLLKDNEKVFKTLGPNSGKESTDKLRNDLTLWYKYRNESIRPNNNKIKDILNSNIQLLDKQLALQAEKMILHIDAFEEHIKNPTFNYSEYQFPKEFSDEVERICFETSSKSKLIRRWRNRLLKNFKKVAIEEWYLIGSAIFTPLTSNDIDIVILLNSNADRITSQKLDAVKLDIKLKTKRNLHLTVFNSSERQSYLDFLNRNRYKINNNG